MARFEPLPATTVGRLQAVLWHHADTDTLGPEIPMSDSEEESVSSTSSTPLSPSAYSEQDSFTSTSRFSDGEDTFLSSEGLNLEGSVDLTVGPADALAITSNAIKDRKRALTHLGALSPSPASASPSPSDFAAYRSSLLSSISLIGSAIALCAPETYPVLNSYLTFHTYHNISLTLSHPEPLSMADGQESSPTANLAKLLTFVKAYNFDKMFSITKQYDHIDYFLSGIWTGAPVLQGKR